MIKYCLNYYEDFVEECKNKRIICVGLDDTFNEKMELILLGFISKIDYCITYEDEGSHPFIKDCTAVIVKFEELRSINLNDYVLLIVTEYVDYIKKLLHEFIDEKVCVNCYTCKFIYRDYGDDNTLKIKRIDNVAMNWYEYYLTHILNTQKKDELLTKRKRELSEDLVRVIPRLVVVLTVKCNLHCENCIALTTHYKKQYDVSANIIIKSIEKITEVIDECTCVELIGGEPFLYKELEKIICYLKSNNKVRFVQITTNGMVFNYDNKYKKLLADNVMVRVSDYSISNNTQKFISWLKNNGICHIVQKDLKWTAVGNIKNKNKNQKEIKDEFNICFEGLNCKTLLNGIIFDCTFSSRIYDLGYMEECELIDVLKENLTWERLLKYWIRNESNACNYCDIMNPNAEIVKCAIQKE